VHTEAGGELLEVFLQTRILTLEGKSAELDSAIRGLGMQLKSTPVDRDVEFRLQSDQTGSLRDITERSDEIGVETHHQCSVFGAHHRTLLAGLHPHQDIASTSMPHDRGDRHLQSDINSGTDSRPRQEDGDEKNRPDPAPGPAALAGLAAAALAVFAFPFIGFPQQSRVLSSLMTSPPTSSTTTANPHTSHAMAWPLLTLLLAVAFAGAAVFFAAGFFAGVAAFVAMNPSFSDEHLVIGYIIHNIMAKGEGAYSLI
jgi:hypothetical protein